MRAIAIFDIDTDEIAELAAGREVLDAREWNGNVYVIGAPAELARSLEERGYDARACDLCLPSELAEAAFEAESFWELQDTPLDRKMRRALLEFAARPLDEIAPFEGGEGDALRYIWEFASQDAADDGRKPPDDEELKALRAKALEAIEGRN